MTTTTATRAAGSLGAPHFCADADEWFHVAELGDGIVLISEPGHVNTFLVRGTDRALLFDTGLGIAPVSEVVRSLTDLPLVVVNSHDHVDHRGGNADLMAHADEIGLVGIGAHFIGVDPGLGGPAGHGPADAAFLRSYAAAMEEVHTQYEAYAALDAQSFYTLAGLGRMRPMPDTTHWAVPAVAPTFTLADGDTIDLGDRTLRVIHTPGHSPDSISLLEEDTGILLAGDTIIGAGFWLHHDGADLAAFAQSTAHLAGLRLRRILTAHNLLAEQPPAYADAVARAAAVVHAGGSHGVPGRDMLGTPVTRHDVGGVTLLLPAPTPGADEGRS
ncbi:MBL fold metallo-hydrolase [Sanguibacter sp. 25GB23B1]|uniref:MBL fold metallo-hydrolase n=1 Tax=unclassified Sanguibacter TaxID=2645534 RepID=UPI0032AEA33A